VERSAAGCSRVTPCLVFPGAFLQQTAVLCTPVSRHFLLTSKCGLFLCVSPLLYLTQLCDSHLHVRRHTSGSCHWIQIPWNHSYSWWKHAHSCWEDGRQLQVCHCQSLQNWWQQGYKQDYGITMAFPGLCFAWQLVVTVVKYGPLLWHMIPQKSPPHMSFTWASWKDSSVLRKVLILTTCSAKQVRCPFFSIGSDASYNSGTVYSLQTIIFLRMLCGLTF